jgi:enoyl-CoA hydratase/carnithine racemase
VFCLFGVSSFFLFSFRLLSLILYTLVIHTPSLNKSLTVSQLNRPKSLNSFGGNLISDVIAAFRYLDEHPDTVFTVLTGEGRFFSAGADVKGFGDVSNPYFYYARG